eukprot:GHVP01052727.1.p1 GENE.GHVP01052727.1~~GHVP01052727.1.p1  ORF type:complete len:207 (+),score=20.90 GHVP01052727.1:186-806(+)
MTSLDQFLGVSFYLLIMEYGGNWIIYFQLAVESVKMLESSHLEEKNKCLSVWLFLPILTFLKIFLFSWIPSSWIPFYYLIKGDIEIIFCTDLVYEKIYNPIRPLIIKFSAFFREFSDPKSKSARWLAHKENFRKGLFIMSLLAFGLGDRLATICIGYFLPIIHTVVAIESSLLEEKNKLLSYWIILTTFSFLELLLENFLFFWLEG